MHRPLPRTVLAAFTLSSLLTVTVTGNGPAAAAGVARAEAPAQAATKTAMKPIGTGIPKLSATASGPSFPTAKGGQSSRRAPKSIAPLGRKLK